MIKNVKLLSNLKVQLYDEFQERVKINYQIYLRIQDNEIYMFKKKGKLQNSIYNMIPVI